MDVLLDSTFLIKAERLRWTAWEVLAALEPHIDDGKVGVSVISIMELAHGAVRADTPERAQLRTSFMDQIAEELEVHPVTLSIAKRAGRLDGLLASQGIRTAPADLLIAATALELRHYVVTGNVRHFRRVPGLRLLVL